MVRFEKWKPLILGARSEEELLKVVREFCALWLPSDLAKLPEQCRHCDPQSSDEIIEMAVVFTTAELRAQDPEVADTLAVMSRTFILASQQLRRIRPSPYLPGRDRQE